ncbi:origin recognition complex subunit 2 NDAI_0A07430 [Naumovozyma dairenensis CBS 421]|uniref:Origin recognition complex subunit 2 n=1 Tax=Naumovozyma dairenensis (strain ATCC 10597 / BCRC 20456 / CBS 421 / NBRC 0211 / NRRL Y-12639) TaxID=1071378 RepID=G0W509_NAUDC|nr:hypothetical protein NDAI_0A07430 [Naumovozyma dairenensis CBS 421]CCD22897.1 hypothetical protein NDAI_0A07430 [Naumovozyma dairenensis CBS 421]
MISDDIIGHDDILASPVKSTQYLRIYANSGSQNRHILNSPRKRRTVSPSKKNTNERIHLERPTEERENLIPKVRNESSKVEEEIPSTIPKKRGRPRKEPTELPEVKSPTPKKRGRPRKIHKKEPPKEEEEQEQREERKKTDSKEKRSTSPLSARISADNILPHSKRIPRKITQRNVLVSSDDSGATSDGDMTEDEVSSPVVSEPEVDIKKIQSFFPPPSAKQLKVTRKKSRASSNEKQSEKKRKQSKKRKYQEQGETGSDNEHEDEEQNSPDTPNKSSSTAHDFTSPLKKVIMDNLKHYKNVSSKSKLNLNKDFIPTALPNDTQYKKINWKNNSSSTFFDTAEGYFAQKKTVQKSSRSTSTMALAPDVTREEFALVTNIFNKEYLKKPREKLHLLQRKMFPQYWFELSQGFTLLFYGIGSKKSLLEEFSLKYLSPKLAYVREANNQKNESLSLSDIIKPPTDGIPCVVINGYNPTINYREVFSDISSILYPADLTRNDLKFWGNLVILQIQKMNEFYKTQPPDIKLIIVVHNLDGPVLRKAAFQTMLSSLAMIRQIAIVASVDHIYAPLLWDNTRAQNYNFIFHDVTDYRANEIESSFYDVMNLGRKEASTGVEGVKYVLQSLTLNSKKMYKLLLEKMIDNMETEAKNNKQIKVRGMRRGCLEVAIEFKEFVTSCTERFIASNEISLRSMLVEYVEHKMALLQKDKNGSEYLWVPFNYSEMKKLLQNVLSDLQ